MTKNNTIPDLLANSKTIAVVGLSPKTHRASYEVAAYMQKHGYRIVPVNPSQAGKLILGEPCYASLQEAAREVQQIDIVNCFRKAEDIMPIADAAIEIGARCLWMQLGITNEAAAVKARVAGISVVMDHCLKIEHSKKASLYKTIKPNP